MATIHASLPRRTPVLLCLGLIALYPLFSVPVQKSGDVLSSRIGDIGTRIVTEGAIWLYAATVLAIAVAWEGRSLASIGIRKPTIETLGFGVSAALAMAAAGALTAYVVYGLLHQPSHANSQAAALVHGSVPYAIFLAVRAGVIEEILFRGLAIEQLALLVGNRWLAASVATLVFILIHALRFDFIQLIPIAVLSIILTTLYMWRRDLVANIIAHVLVDGVGLVALALQTSKLRHS